MFFKNTHLLDQLFEPLRLEAGTEADVMIYGLGPVSTSTTLFEGSFIDTDVLEELHRLGAVGEIGGRFFSIDGTPTAGSLPSRTVSVELDAIRACAGAILISGGRKKHQAMLGALRGGFASVLVTDIESARWLTAQKGPGVEPAGTTQKGPGTTQKGLGVEPAGTTQNGEQFK